MKTDDLRRPLARRFFLGRIGAALGAGGALAGTSAALQGQSPDRAGWQPARHAQDDWLDQVPGKHRFILDTTTAAAFGGALLYVNNYLAASENAYGLPGSELAVVIVARHFSTPFAYTDPIWAKYGRPLADVIQFHDPVTNQPPTINVFNSTAHRMLPNSGILLDNLLKRGVRVAVCQMATRFFAGVIAAKSGGNADSIYTELTTNVVANVHFVPAGIVAVNRAQERGYSFAYVG